MSDSGRSCPFETFVRSGYLYIPSQKDLEATHSVVQDPAETRRYEWLLHSPWDERHLMLPSSGCVWEAYAGYVDARRELLDTTRKLVSYGVALLDGVKASRLSQGEAEAFVETNIGTFTCRSCVLTTGYATPALLNSIGVDHDLFSRSIQVCLYEGDFPDDLPAFTDDELNIYGRPGDRRGTLYIGSPTTAERPTSCADEPIDLAHAEATQEVASQRFPAIQHARLIGGARHTDCYSRYAEPFVKRLPTGADRFIVCTGFSGGGLKMAPWASESVVDILGTSNY
jgi:glycine/D-amino acid oxidase-like deaminating enzyme